jgi:hypothetical protein
MNPTDILNTDNSFWDSFPDLKVAGKTKEVYTKDKSKGKKDSSKLMWFVALCYNPDSTFYKLPPEEKHVLIGSDYMNDSKFYEKNEDTLESLIEFYQYLNESPARRSLREWNEKIIQRAKFIKNTDYSLDQYEQDEETGRGKLVKGTAEQLDKMMESTKKIYDDYQRILESLENEEAGGTAKGGGEASLTDKGYI